MKASVRIFIVIVFLCFAPFNYLQAYKFVEATLTDGDNNDIKISIRLTNEARRKFLHGYEMHLSLWEEYDIYNPKYPNPQKYNFIKGVRDLTASRTMIDFDLLANKPFGNKTGIYMTDDEEGKSEKIPLAWYHTGRRPEYLRIKRNNSNAFTVIIPKNLLKHVSYNQISGKMDLWCFIKLDFYQSTTEVSFDSKENKITSLRLLYGYTPTPYEYELTPMESEHGVDRWIDVTVHFQDHLHNLPDKFKMRFSVWGDKEILRPTYDFDNELSNYPINWNYYKPLPLTFDPQFQSGKYNQSLTSKYVASLTSGEMVRLFESCKDWDIVYSFDVIRDNLNDFSLFLSPELFYPTLEDNQRLRNSLRVNNEDITVKRIIFVRVDLYDMNGNFLYSSGNWPKGMIYSFDYEQEQFVSLPAPPTEEDTTHIHSYKPDRYSADILPKHEKEPVPHQCKFETYQYKMSSPILKKENGNRVDKENEKDKDNKVKKENEKKCAHLHRFVHPEIIKENTTTQTIIIKNEPVDSFSIAGWTVKVSIHDDDKDANNGRFLVDSKITKGLWNSLMMRDCSREQRTDTTSIYPSEEYDFELLCDSINYYCKENDISFEIYYNDTIPYPYMDVYSTEEELGDETVVNKNIYITVKYEYICSLCGDKSSYTTVRTRRFSSDRAAEQFKKHLFQMKSNVPERERTDIPERENTDVPEGEKTVVPEKGKTFYQVTKTPLKRCVCGKTEEASSQEVETKYFLSLPEAETWIEKWAKWEPSPIKAEEPQFVEKPYWEVVVDVVFKCEECKKSKIFDQYRNIWHDTFDNEEDAKKIQKEWNEKECSIFVIIT